MAISALPATIVVGNGEYCQSPGPDHTTASGPGHFHANVRSTFCGPGRKHPIFVIQTTFPHQTLLWISNLCTFQISRFVAFPAFGAMAYAG